MRWQWRRSRDLDRRAESAQQEVERSRELLARDRREVINPMKAAARDNHFSVLIRNALASGYGRNHEAG